jgi:c-di-GMP-binding flagellar brake protein YcgR
MTDTTAPLLGPELLAPEGLEDFRISQPLEIQTLLSQMADQNIMIALTTPGGATYTTTVWEVDRTRQVVRMGADLIDRQLDQVLGSNEVMAVGYLEQVKIQFEVQSLMRVKGEGDTRVLNCLFPLEIYRFQRRSNFRVRPLHTPPPVVRFRVRPSTDPLELRVIDVSATGVALLMPEGAAAPRAGSQVVAVDVELDVDTYFVANLQVMHASPLRQDLPGVRLGCEFEGLTGPALRALQRFIDQTQKRRRAMAWTDE